MDPLAACVYRAGKTMGGKKTKCVHFKLISTWQNLSVFSSSAIKHLKMWQTTWTWSGLQSGEVRIKISRVNVIFTFSILQQQLYCGSAGSDVCSIKVKESLINCQCIKSTAAKHSLASDMPGQTRKQLFKDISHSSLYTVIIFQIIMCCKIYWPLVNLYLPSWNS